MPGNPTRWDPASRRAAGSESAGRPHGTTRRSPTSVPRSQRVAGKRSPAVRASRPSAPDTHRDAAKARTKQARSRVPRKGRIQFGIAIGVRDAWPAQQNGTRLRAGAAGSESAGRPHGTTRRSPASGAEGYRQRVPHSPRPSRRRARRANLAPSRVAAKFRHRPRREGCLASPIEGDSASCRADGMTEARRGGHRGLPGAVPTHPRGGNESRGLTRPSAPLSAFRLDPPPL